MARSGSSNILSCLSTPDGYTYLEHYLNSLVQAITEAQNQGGQVQGRMEYGDDNPVQYVEVSDPGSEGFALMEKLNGDNHYFKAFDHGKLAANSDHWPFAQKGVPCILFENESGSAFPFYHTHHDDMEHFRTETYEPLFHLITDFIQANDN